MNYEFRATSIVARFIFWCVVCGISAWPSFFLASQNFSEPKQIGGMCLGILTFVIAYTWVTGTRTFQEFRERPFVTSTLWTGFTVRLLISIVFPIGMFVDVWSGMLSMELVMGSTATGQAASPLEVFGTTLVQGTILNILLFIFMAMMYGLQRLIFQPPRPRGICRNCGYDLRASPHVCPECGLHI